jgi:hypothetical protein
MNAKKRAMPLTRNAKAAGVLILLIGLSSHGGSLDAPFTRLTTGPWTESAQSVSVAAGDYNNDGWPDLFVGRHGTLSALYRNDHGTNFVKETSGPIATTLIGSAHAAAWADYDNDGWPDLVVANLKDPRFPSTYLFHGLGNGSFEQVLSGPLTNASGRSVAVSWADYTGDGLLDLFVGRGAVVLDVPDTLYRNDGPAGFSVDTNLTFAALRTDQGIWGDFDGDGDLDLLVVHAGLEGNTLYRNNGQGRLEVVQGSGLTQLGQSGGAAWGDFDNDGYLDLIVINWGYTNPPSTNFFYHNNGDGTFTQITNGPIATELGYFMSCSWVDFDNDGWLDLFVAADPVGDPRGLRNRLYHNQGDGTFVRMTGGQLVTDSARFAGSAWLDYDNDGFPDVLVACGSIWTPQPSALYHNNGNTNAWIKLRCVGTVSNRSAIGTTIRLKARIAGTDRWQMRQILGTEGWLSFNDLTQIIGLGDATVVDTLRIEWPSGIVQELRNVPVRQTLVIVEQTTLSIAKTDDTNFELQVTGPRQQRYALEASTDLQSWSQVASLTITNANGTVAFQGVVGPEPARYFRAKAE